VKSPYRYPANWLGGFVLGQSPLGDPNDFPVAAGVQKTILAYLYLEWRSGSGSDDLQAFVNAYNELAQYYVEWFNSASLPIYPLQEGPLLDWLARGIYGFLRPLLPSGSTQDIGALGTYVFGGIAFGDGERIGPSDFFATTDDVFRRIMTWYLYLGDGKTFSVRWLKRRVMRFLLGQNGYGGLPIPSDIVMALDSFGNPVTWPTYYNIDNAYQISVSFAGTSATIRIVAGIRREVTGAMFGEFAFGDTGAVFGSMVSTFTALGQFAMAPIFKAAVEAGVLELPVGYDWTVQVN